MPEPEPPAELSSLRLDAELGFAHFTQSKDAVLAGLALVGRYRSFAALGLIEGSSPLFGFSSGAQALGVGLSYTPKPPLSLEAFLIAGARQYRGVGGDGEIFGDPGASGTVPFAGLRGGVGFGPRAYLGLAAGLVGFLNVDLAHKDVTYTFEGGTLSEPIPVTRTRTIGEVNFGALIRFGIQVND